MYVQAVEERKPDPLTDYLRKLVDHLKLLDTNLRMDREAVYRAVHAPDSRILGRPDERTAAMAAAKEREKQAEDKEPKTGRQVIADVFKSTSTPLKKDVADRITAIMHQVALAHSAEAETCELLGEFAAVAPAQTVKLVLEAVATRPRLSYTFPEGAIQEVKAETQASAAHQQADNYATLVITNCLPNPEHKALKNANASTRILAAVAYIAVLREVIGGRAAPYPAVAEMFRLTEKQLKLYITGRRYKGGSKKKDKKPTRRSG